MRAHPSPPPSLPLVVAVCRVCGIGVQADYRLCRNCGGNRLRQKLKRIEIKAKHGLCAGIDQTQRLQNPHLDSDEPFVIQHV